MKPRVFEKAYTREYSVIMEGPWTYALTEGFEKRFGLRNPYQPPVIYHISDGVIEVWEDPVALGWVMEQVRAKCADKEFMPAVVKRYNAQLAYFTRLGKKGAVETVQELNEYCMRIDDAMVDFVCFYFPAIDDQAPAHARKLATMLREKDVFFTQCDNVIRASLQKLYPALADCVTMITQDEIGNPPSRDVLLTRKNNWVMIPKSVSEITTLAQFAQKHPEFSFAEEKVTAEESIHGQIAHKGVVQGRVRIIKRKDQVASVHEGDILVSPMTIPDFLPAMRKAAAIVTDEGGVMCHAAIIARELKKPCIIGTKNATKALKDGDQVEVDADNGVVRKLA